MEIIFRTAQTQPSQYSVYSDYRLLSAIHNIYRILIILNMGDGRSAHIGPIKDPAHTHTHTIFHQAPIAPSLYNSRLRLLTCNPCIIGRSVLCFSECASNSHRGENSLWCSSHWGPRVNSDSEISKSQVACNFKLA